MFSVHSTSILAFLHTYISLIHFHLSGDFTIRLVDDIFCQPASAEIVAIIVLNFFLGTRSLWKFVILGYLENMIRVVILCRYFSQHIGIFFKNVYMSVVKEICIQKIFWKLNSLLWELLIFSINIWLTKIVLSSHYLLLFFWSPSSSYFQLLK